MTPLTRIAELQALVKALLPDAGEVHIIKCDPTATVQMWISTIPLADKSYFLYIEDTPICKSFNTFKELENYLVRAIHGLSMLQNPVVSAEKRTRQDCLRRAFGTIEKREEN